MSVAPSSESEQEAGESGMPPETAPLMPILQLSSTEPRLQVIYTAEEAMLAAQVSPDDELYDARGIALTPLADGVAEIEARGEARAGELQERVIAELRATLERSELEGAEAAEVREGVEWLKVAPTFELLLHGLALAPVDGDIVAPAAANIVTSPDLEPDVEPGIGPDIAQDVVITASGGHRCDRCSAWRKLFRPRGCC